MEFQNDPRAAAEAESHEFCCPYCKSKIGHPPIWCRFCLRVLDPSVMIECINCSEPLLIYSRFCRFCKVALRIDLSLTSYSGYIKLQVIVQRLTHAFKGSGPTFKKNATSDNHPGDDDDPPPFASVRRMPLPPPPDDYYVSLDWRGQLKS